MPQRTYKSDMTPMNRIGTKNLWMGADIRKTRTYKDPKGYAPATKQNKTIKPDIPRIRAHVLEQVKLDVDGNESVETYNQFLRAHQSVNKKNAARTRQAILLALVSNPQAIKQAPMSEEPRYPAGRVIQGIPPNIRVSPPSSAADMV